MAGGRNTAYLKLAGQRLQRFPFLYFLQHFFLGPFFFFFFLPQMTGKGK